ncbi:MAG: hypothetical protein GY747_01540 [Planctomycetes bacterium]|nr:hypothetical protein [Planctomycetota bacterium]MCP4769911.1 hypothetical protein [Planctomycetota bacterium]MCP4859751.1 hypothetical protein [Planctomycetota bacterium]
MKLLLWQEQDAAVFDPSTAPELPSEVEALSIAYGYWLLFVAAALLVLWMAWQWLRHAQEQRKTLQHERKIVAAEASASSAQRAWALLHSYLQDLSPDQRREAECLSHLLREQVGRGLKRDCHSATDAEILAVSSSTSGAGDGAATAGADRALIDLAPAILKPLLAFTSGVLFADHRPSVSNWQATLRDVEAWLETQGEEL